jgi:hypothetical protein
MEYRDGHYRPVRPKWFQAVAESDWCGHRHTRRDLAVRCGRRTFKGDPFTIKTTTQRPTSR